MSEAPGEKRATGKYRRFGRPKAYTAVVKR